MDPANVDVVNHGSAGAIPQGNVAQILMANNFNVASLRTCDVLKYDDWKRFDETVIETAKQRLVGITDFMSRGLRMSVDNAMSVMSLQWELMDDMSPANVSMSGVTEGENDRVAFQPNTLPLPIVHKDFNINARVLAASRRGGLPLDTTQAAQASRVVSEGIEKMLFDGYSVGEAGSQIYGLTNAPYRNTGSITDWSLPATTGATMVTEVLEMIQAAKDEHMYGPYALYIPSNYGTRLNDDYKADSDKTISQRILEIRGIEYIQESDNLTNEVVLVQLTRDVIDIVDGIQPTTLQWPSNGGMTTHFKVLAIMVPRVKWTYSQQSGITHFSV